MGAWDLCSEQSQNTGASVPQGSTGREVIRQGAPMITIELSNVKFNDGGDDENYEAMEIR